jgi:hypothetical protein
MADQVLLGDEGRHIDGGAVGLIDVDRGGA